MSRLHRGRTKLRQRLLNFAPRGLAEAEAPREFAEAS
jgi:hypothetical protein